MCKVFYYTVNVVALPWFSLHMPKDKTAHVLYSRNGGNLYLSNSPALIKVSIFVAKEIKGSQVFLPNMRPL